ncbi:MAG TPA: carboxypeptidase regulatory-like domain-containing protein [Blastocatellia bacterium]|nr:carboxypeptidase regulatory-like domain-containing protein [Blastocatellia bacterium]
MKRIICVALALFAFTAFVIAQDFRATIGGLVTDQNGQVVANATVKAIRVDTNEAKEVKTTSEGRYTIPYLTPSIYTIEVTASGFQTLKRETITLRIADKLDLPLRLTVGAVSEAIVVTGQQEVLEAGSADRGLVFDPIKTQELPLNGRQTYMLLALTPGVVFTQETFGPNGFSGTRGWDVNNSYKINGARTGQNLFLLNGAPISDNNGTWQVAPNVEAVQEFKVMTNTYDASYGRFGGGVVNTTLKSGANSWNGNVFDYFRNAVFDANYFQNNFTGQPKPKHNQHQYGGVFGGPIRKDKDFIFTSFEGWIERIGFPTLQSVPPDLLRDGQHFTDFGIKIYDPMTTHRCGEKPGETDAFCTVNGQRRTFVRDPFPGNVIPADRLSPIGKKLLSYYPKASAGLEMKLRDNFVNGGNVGKYYYYQPMARWDHIFSEKDKLNFTFTFQHGQEYRDSTGFGPPAGSGDVGSQRTDQNYIISWTHVVSPTTLLDVRASYGRFTSYFPRWTDFSLTAADVGMTQMITAPSTDLKSVPRIRTGDFTGLFASVGGDLFTWSTTNQWNLAPSLTMTRGRHTLRFGGEVHYYALGSQNTGYGTGTFDFNSGWTQQFPDVRRNGQDGSTIASLLLGTPAGGNIDWNDTIYQTRPYFGIYVQDDWKLNSKLTLNLGLRYDVQIPWLERFNRRARGWDITTKNPYSDAVLANWAQVKAKWEADNPDAKYPYPAAPAELIGGYLFAGVGGQPERLYDTDWTNIAPRIGVAYRMFEKTVLRAGAGVYYQSPTQNNVSPGFNQGTPYTSSLDGLTPSAGLTGPYSLVNPFPDGLRPATGSSLGLATGVGGGAGFDPPRFKIPRTYQYSLGFQHELPGGILAEASYTGNYQIYINNSYNMNRWSLADNMIGFVDNSYLNRKLPNPFFGVLPQNTSLGSSPTISAQELLRPNPIFGDITNFLIQDGRYRSDQLQLKVEKRVLGGGGGLTFGLSYTLAKAFEKNHRLNNWNDAEDLIYELDNTDKTHNLSVYGVWDLPLGKGRRFNVGNPVGGALLNNWSFDWILTYVNGNPVGWPDLINKCGAWNATEQDEDHWFNNDKTCYQKFPGFNVRTTPDRFPDIREQQKPQLNLALSKTWALTERYKFLLRWEAFNVANTVIRPGPDTNIDNATFGMLPKRQNNFPRVMQVAAKFYF